MKIITIHIETRDERQAVANMRKFKSNTDQLNAIAARMNRNITREMYGATEGILTIQAPGR